MTIVHIVSGIGCLVVGIAIGILIMTTIIPPTEISVITEKIVEVEKPIVTQQIVEIVREVKVFRFIDEDQPVHKWVDPDNQAVVYIYPEGYTGQVMPMYSLVPPVWFEQLLKSILRQNDGTMPQKVMEAIPKEWFDAVAPKILEDGSF